MDKLDTILGSEEHILPSSGFAATVMLRVRQEAAAPPPISFPWKRAIPGFILAAVVLGEASLQFMRIDRASGIALGSVASLLPLGQSGAWLYLALALAAASWLIVRRLTSPSGLL